MLFTWKKMIGKREFGLETNNSGGTQGGISNGEKHRVPSRI